MVLWILLALMTGAAVLAVLLPLSRTRPFAAGPGDVSFYTAQLAEIERERERGLIAPQEAEAARIETGRRLLKAADVPPDTVDATSEPALRRRRAASALALCVVPIVGLAFYGGLGSPHLAVRPARTEVAERPPAPDAEIVGALRKVEDHLSAQPDDLRGWEVVAPIYMRMGRWSDAVRAYSEARRIGGDSPPRLLGQGEAVVAAAGGSVDEDARALFRRVVALDPASPPGRYYLALAAEQDGDRDAARDGYRAVLADASPDAPYVPLVRSRMKGLGGEAPAARPVLKEVPPEVIAMVSGLDARLAAGGGSEAEWARLIRSFVVLGRPEDARDRLGRARTILAGDPEALGRLDGLAGELGLAPAVARR